MIRFVKITTTVVVAIVSYSFFSKTVHAEPDLNSIQNERSEIKEELSEAESKIKDVLLDIKKMNEEIARLEDALEENEVAMEEANEKIEELDTEIHMYQVEIDKLENNIEARNEILKNRIAAYQKTGGNISYLEVLLGSKDFGEFISRLSAVTKITNADKKLIEKQEADKRKVERKQNEIKQKLEEQKELKIELKGMIDLITEQQKTAEQDKQELKKKEEELKDLKSNLITRDNRLQQLEQEIRNEIETFDPTSTTTTKTTTNHPNKINKKGSKNSAIQAGYKHLGTPYRWAGRSPAGFDCSGFVSWAYGQAGYSLPSSTAGLSRTGVKISYSDIQPGDLVFFDTYKKDGHVGIYVGNGQFIGSQNSTGLAVASMNSTYWSKNFKGHVRRIQ